MADQIQVASITGKTIYALVRNSAAQVWQTTTSTFVSYVSANLSNYSIPLTEQGTSSGYYAGAFPGAAVGIYSVVSFIQSGGSPAEGDLVIGTGNIEWNGSSFSIDPLYETVETNYTLQQTLRLILSSVVAKLSGANTNTVTIRDINDTVNRIVATVDQYGDRTAITVNVS